MNRRSYRVFGRGDAHRLVAAMLPDGATAAHRFAPHGESVARIGAAGSVAVHTWPEHALATLDVYGLAAPTADQLRDAGWHLIEEEPWT